MDNKEEQECCFPTCHVMVSMALTNQRRSSEGRKTSYGNERAVDKSKARSQNIKGSVLKNSGFHTWSDQPGTRNRKKYNARSGTVPCPLFFF